MRFWFIIIESHKALCLDHCWANTHLFLFFKLLLFSCLHTDRQDDDTFRVWHQVEMAERVIQTQQRCSLWLNRSDVGHRKHRHVDLSVQTRDEARWRSLNLTAVVSFLFCLSCRASHHLSQVNCTGAPEPWNGRMFVEKNGHHGHTGNSEWHMEEYLRCFDIRVIKRITGRAVGEHR